jgi:hypothetical protein
LLEIEKLKQQRLKREGEKRAALEERDRLARSVAAQAADEDWEQFQLNQNVQRAGNFDARVSTLSNR